MAVVTHAGSTWNTTAGDKTVTATPAVGDLIVVVAASSGLAGGTTAVTDDQGGSGANTYIQVDSDRTGFSTTGVLTVWVRPILVTSAVSTIYTAAQSGSTGGGLVVLRVAGMIRTGAAAIRGNGGESTGGAGTTPAPVLSFIPLLQNPIITACANGSNGAAITQRTGYTETEPAGYNTPATGLSVSSLNSGETSQTITYGGTSATAFASFALELDASTPTYTRGRSFPPGRKMPRKPLTEAKGEAAGVPVTEQVTFGGAIAAGPGPIAQVAVSQGGAQGIGNTLTVKAAVAPGGAVAAGNAPSASASVTQGGALANGVGPSPVVVTLTSGGAIAAGNAPLAPTFETPAVGGGTAAGTAPRALVLSPFGGAAAAGVAPSTSASATPGGAISGGTTPFAATVLTLQGSMAIGLGASANVILALAGAVAGGNAPVEFFPSAVVTTRNFDTPSPIPTAFDPPVPIGQVG